MPRKFASVPKFSLTMRKSVVIRNNPLKISGLMWCREVLF